MFAKIVEVWEADPWTARCCAADPRRPIGSVSAVEMVPCQAMTRWGLTWVGASGYWHSGPRCGRHLLLDLGPMIRDRAEDWGRT